MTNTSLFCACDKWKKNIEAVIAGTVFMANRGLGEYKGEKFKHCPWCGASLIVTRDEPEPPRNTVSLEADEILSMSKEQMELFFNDIVKPDDNN